MSIIQNIIKVFPKLAFSYKEPYPDIHMLDFKVVNVFIISNVQMRKFDWVIIDTGFENSGSTIIKTGEKLFGILGNPKAIVLTQARSDHIGGIVKILEHWNIPVYIHADEVPYLTGEKTYPFSERDIPNLPNKIINNFNLLQEESSVPCMPEWNWIHTPGPSAGHISLFRESDQVLIPGDILINPKQKPSFSIVSKKEQIDTSLQYLNTDPVKYKASIELLKKLNPKFALPSHGKPIQGKALSEHIESLITDYEEISAHTQYEQEPINF